MRIIWMHPCITPDLCPLSWMGSVQSAVYRSGARPEAEFFNCDIKIRNICIKPLYLSIYDLEIAVYICWFADLRSLPIFSGVFSKMWKCQKECKKVSCIVNIDGYRRQDWRALLGRCVSGCRLQLHQAATTGGSGGRLATLSPSGGQY